MEIPRKKAELFEIVRSLGIESYVQKKFAKTVKDEDGNPKETTGRMELVRAIQRYYLEQRYGSVENTPKHLQLILRISPQLACRKNQIKETLWQTAWTSKEYVVEEKLNGLRFLLIYLPHEGLHVYSRHIDANELLPIEYTEKFVHSADMNHFPWSFMIDSELRCTNPYVSTILDKHGVVTETELQAVASLLQLNVKDSRRIQIEQEAHLIPHSFDCMFFDGEDIINSPLYERRRILQFLVRKLEAVGFHIVCHSSYLIPGDKKYQMYERILEQGGEGMIAKRIDSPYSPDKRNGDWIKFKRSANQVLGDTISGWISGYKRGKKDGKFENYVGSVEVSCYVTDDLGEPSVKSIAWVKGFTMEELEHLTSYDEFGTPFLTPEYRGKVMEVDGQCFSPRSKHLVHARFVEWRLDKQKEDCTLAQSDIDKQIV
jgi:ATP-dependent DNA ligase